MDDLGSFDGSVTGMDQSGFGNQSGVNENTGLGDSGGSGGSGNIGAGAGGFDLSSLSFSTADAVQLGGLAIGIAIGGMAGAFASSSIGIGVVSSLGVAGGAALGGPGQIGQALQDLAHDVLELTGQQMAQGPVSLFMTSVDQGVTASDYGSGGSAVIGGSAIYFNADHTIATIIGAPPPAYPDYNSGYGGGGGQ